MRLFKSSCAFVIVSSLVACASTDSESANGGSGTDAVPQVAINGGQAATDSPSAPTTTPDGAVVEELGTVKGHWNGKTLTLDQTQGQAGIKTQAFVQVPDAKMSLMTDEALAVTTACPQNVGPSYYLGPQAQPMSNGGTCANEHLCGLVTITNDSTRDLDRVFLQITSVTPGFAPDGPVIADVPAGYPLDNSKGLFAYGSLPAGGAGGAQAQLDFPLAGCGDFYFEAKIMGTVRRTSYMVSRTTLTTQDEWIDACSLPGMTRVLQNAGPNASVSNIALPFPFTLYDLTFDSDENPNLSISSNGAIGFSPITSDHVSLPDMSGASDYTIFPYWTKLDPGANGVCYGVTGAAPNRKMVITWKNANVVNSAAAENMTFSTVLNETSDLIQFYYARHSDGQASCQSTSGPSRGSLSTIGIQGSGIATQFSYNTTSLPVHTSTCMGNLERINLTPVGGNTF
jgi:hypothetical protein